MKRSILIVFGLMLTALNGWSNDYNYLVFVTNTGPRSIAVEDLEMTVSESGKTKCARFEKRNVQKSGKTKRSKNFAHTTL